MDMRYLGKALICRPAERLPSHGAKEGKIAERTELLEMFPDSLARSPRLRGNERCPRGLFRKARRVVAPDFHGLPALVCPQKGAVSSLVRGLELTLLSRAAKGSDR